MSEMTSGRVACETWQTCRIGVDRTGTWDLLSPEQRGHWEAVAQAVLRNAEADFDRPAHIAARDLSKQLADERALRLRLAGERDEARSDYSRLRRVLLEGGQSDAAVRKRCLAIIATAGTPADGAT